ncbi:Putative DD37D maT transposase [Caligus rogercresseyi]|uniref:DD37D maT transposase n=1 Tax=Caligus rogercresseyi TaxID=217165 RepID=A0A7T8KD67_CALRO|nr:Putative DD37D maT transposase [Caligus rogercresseyi]
MDLESKRTTIVKLLDSGQSPKAIMIMLGLSKRQAKPQGSLNKERSDQPSPADTSLPARSMNKMAQEYNVSARTIGKVVKAGLGMKPFKYRKIHLLNEATRGKRKATSKLVLKWHADNPSVVVIFSDEKLFETTKKFNPQNDRILEYQKRLPDAEAGICDYLGTVASNGKKSPLLRIPDGVKINKIVYLDFLNTKVFQEEFCGVPLRPILQRLCRTSVQPIFTTFGARSFGLSHLLIASPLTLKANAKPRVNKDQLMATAEAAWNKFTEEIVRIRCTGVVKRLRAVVRANVGYVE